MKALLHSPFLINQTALPHMTKTLMENWDKGTLALTDVQKKALLKIRKDTMQSVKSIKKQVKSLEAKIIEASFDTQTLQSMEVDIDALAKLKAQGTKTHLKCIAETIEVLTDAQIELLFPFWDA